ncbi:hypothetical protein DFJ74DRAFT_706968 [Hyaloraphidium curvatum]|nr:hypothetical protein DFJ74DRAFT_706968 [Hyaloraphidium curvatum]
MGNSLSQRPNPLQKQRDVYDEGIPDYKYATKEMRSVLGEVKPQREIPWIYLVVVAGAPVAHWLVSFSSTMPTRRARHMVWGLAAGATTWMVWNRLVLWHDAGYAGGERPKSERFVEYDENGKPKNSAIRIRMLVPV